MFKIFSFVLRAALVTFGLAAFAVFAAGTYIVPRDNGITVAFFNFVLAVPVAAALTLWRVEWKWRRAKFIATWAMVLPFLALIGCVLLDTHAMEAPRTFIVLGAWLYFFGAVILIVSGIWGRMPLWESASAQA